MTHDISKNIAHDRLVSLLDYDANTGIFVRRNNKRKLGYLHPYGYIYIRLCGVRYFAHRLAWFYVYREWPEYELDHINLNKSDNRIVNLRNATKSQNNMNRSVRSDNTTGYKGVSFDKRSGGYKAQIKIDGKGKQIGVFKTAYEASIAYKNKAKEIHGEFFRY